MTAGRREPAESGIQYIVGHGQVEVSDGAGSPVVAPMRQLFLAASDQRDDAAVFVDAGLGVLVDVQQDCVVKQGAGAFRN